MFATSHNEAGLLVHVFECSEHSFEGFQSGLGLGLGELFVITGSFRKEFFHIFDFFLFKESPLESAVNSGLGLDLIDVSATVCVDFVEDFLRVFFTSSNLLLSRLGTTAFGLLGKRVSAFLGRLGFAFRLVSAFRLVTAFAVRLAVVAACFAARARRKIIHSFLGLVLGELFVITGSGGKVFEHLIGIFFCDPFPLDSTAKSEYSLGLIDVSATVCVDLVEDILRGCSILLLFGRLGTALRRRRHITLLNVTSFLFKKRGGRGSECEKSGGVEFHRFFELCVFFIINLIEKRAPFIPLDLSGR